MLEKIKKYQNHPYFKQLHDVRVLGLLVFASVAVLVSWSTISAIQTNYGLQKQISAVQQQNTVLELKNTNQKLANQYYNSNQFLELAARRQFGLAAPNEKLILVPKAVALAQVGEVSAQTAVAAEAPAQTSSFQKNFKAWMDFFQHRQTDS
ncbi:MAG: septum formation initiator family protein [Candidatus Saccharimonadales bacterium]